MAYNVPDQRKAAVHGERLVSRRSPTYRLRTLPRRTSSIALPQGSQSKIERPQASLIHRASVARLNLAYKTPSMRFGLGSHSSSRGPETTVAAREGVPIGRRVIVENLMFKMVEAGTKLVQCADGAGDGQDSPPEEIVIGHISYKRASNGELRCAVASCFDLLAPARESLCATFTRQGNCALGNQCQKTHDPRKISICPSVLLDVRCSSGWKCDLAHVAQPEITPHCIYAMEENCKIKTCLFSHAIVSAENSFCEEFTNTGYCHQGFACIHHHLRECPEYTIDKCCSDETCTKVHSDLVHDVTKYMDEGDAYVNEVEPTKVRATDRLYEYKKKPESIRLSEYNIEPELVKATADSVDFSSQIDFVSFN